jgi:hypothetical protein
LNLQLPAQPAGSVVRGSGGAGRIGSPPVATVWMQELGAWLKMTLWTLSPAGYVKFTV